MKKLIILPLMLVGLLSLNTVKPDARTGKIEANVAKLATAIDGIGNDLKKLQTAIEGNAKKIETFAEHLQKHEESTEKTFAAVRTSVHSNGEAIATLTHDAKQLHKNTQLLKGIVDNNAKSVLAVPGTIKRALTEMKDHTEMEQQKYDSALTRLNDKVFPKEEGKKKGMFGGWFGN
ncbi:hypothetical protein HOM50_03315 [bacterium]|jgi:septal ring factor EnvC (AmiA/AmiB activator)|nr:hypothetical protein [bacterium]MBT5015406.1 hypothetical protein [bacterium]